jgi:hypothetical protein
VALSCPAKAGPSRSADAAAQVGALLNRLFDAPLREVAGHLAGGQEVERDTAPTLTGVGDKERGVDQVFGDAHLGRLLNNEELAAVCVQGLQGQRERDRLAADLAVGEGPGEEVVRITSRQFLASPAEKGLRDV